MLGREVFRALFQRNNTKAIATAAGTESEEDTCEEGEVEDIFDSPTVDA